MLYIDVTVEGTDDRNWFFIYILWEQKALSKRQKERRPLGFFVDYQRAIEERDRILLEEKLDKGISLEITKEHVENL